MSELIYSQLKGAQKVLNVYDDHIQLTQIQNFRTLLTQDWFQGEKEIFFYDITSVQFKSANQFILGFIQFEVPGVHSRNNFGSENSWTFEASQNDIAKEVCEYIRTRVREIKQPTNNSVNKTPFSPAGEVLKLKELLDLGIISQEEFNTKKKQLLGL